MQREPNHAAREAVGCFLMLVLGAIVCVGFMRITALAVSQGMRAGRLEWWHTSVVWVVVPAALGAFVFWMTYRLRGLRSGEKRR
jgi:uncharacterized membrane protein YdbT with pleckstrin-like domain